MVCFGEFCFCFLFVLFCFVLFCFFWGGGGGAGVGCFCCCCCCCLGRGFVVVVVVVVVVCLFSGGGEFVCFCFVLFFVLFFIFFVFFTSTLHEFNGVSNKRKLAKTISNHEFLVLEGDSYKGPIIRNAFLCHDVIMLKDTKPNISGDLMMTSSNGNISAFLVLCAGNSPVIGEFQSKGQWRGALMFSLICASINGWVNNREAGDMRRHHVIVMCWYFPHYLKKDLLCQCSYRCYTISVSSNQTVFVNTSIFTLQNISSCFQLSWDPTWSHKYSIHVFPYFRPMVPRIYPGPLALCDKMFYHQIPRHLEATRYGFRVDWSLWNLNGNVAEVPLKLQSDRIILTCDLAASRFHEILWWDDLPLCE